MSNDALTITREQAYGGKVPPIPDTHEDAGLVWMENGKAYDAWLTSTGYIRGGVFNKPTQPRILLRRKAAPRRWVVEEVTMRSQGHGHLATDGDCISVRIVSEAPPNESEEIKRLKKQVSGLQLALIEAHENLAIATESAERHQKRIDALEAELARKNDCYDTLLRGNQGLLKCIAELEERAEKAEAVCARVIAVADKHGWDGVCNSKILEVFLDQELTDSNARIAELTKALRNLAEDCAIHPMYYCGKHYDAARAVLDGKEP